MKIVLQRVSRASVSVEGKKVGSIGRGLLVLLGVEKGDTEKDADFLVEKTLNLRIFPDEQKNMNRSVMDIGGALLVVSQFTLPGDCRKGRRPSFDKAAPPELAEALYERFKARAKECGLPVESGVFQAMMDVELVNDGPVTFILESR